MVLELANVHKVYTPGFIPRKRTVIHDLSFGVGAGEVFGFLGPNGAGKTTTIKLLVGLLFPERGAVRLRGLDSHDPRSREALGFLPENPYFYDYLTGREFLDFYGRLYGLDGQRRRRRITELLDQFGIASAADLALRRYSKGMVQRIGFAQALLGEPSILILDEPMSGLDPVGRRLFRDIILEQRARGVTVFFSSHILQDAEMICDRVAILVAGRLRSLGNLSDLLGVGERGYELTFTGAAAVEWGDGVEVVTRSAAGALVRVPTLAVADAVAARVREAGGTLSGLVAARATLEDIFLSEVQASNQEQGVGA